MQGNISASPFFFRLLVIFSFFFGASGVSSLQAEQISGNDLADSGLIVQQDSSYRKNVNEAAAEPEHWKRRYTDEEHRNAKPVIIDLAPSPASNNISEAQQDGDNLPRSIDLKTGVERIESIKVNPSLMEKSDKILNSKQLPINKDLSGLIDIIDTTIYPYSTVVKIFFQKSNGLTSMCSGALIAPSVVITAAHCVHDGSFNWYSNFEIIPAYYERASGVAGIIVVDQEPFGRAYGTNMRSWSYGTGNMDSDIAVINLDRPVGGLTSWLGLGTSNNCSTVTDQQYTSAGYPAYDNRFSHCLNYSSDAIQMVHHSGTFDSCVDGNALNNTDITCGGQSGSAYWDSSNTVRIILSGAYGDKGRSAMIEDYEYESMQAFKADSLPTEVTLEPLGMIATESLENGEQFSLLNFTVFNHSSQDFTGDVEATVYLSDKKTISLFDTSLGTYT